MVTVVLGDLLCAVGFCGAGLFFFLGCGVGLSSMVIINFMLFTSTPPDNIIITQWGIIVNTIFRKF